MEAVEAEEGAAEGWVSPVPVRVSTAREWRVGEVELAAPDVGAGADPGAGAGPRGGVGAGSPVELTAGGPGPAPAEASAEVGARGGTGGRVAAARTWLLLRCGLELRTVVALAAVLVVASVLAVRHYVTGRPQAVAVPAAVPVAAQSPRPAPTARRELTIDVAGKVVHPGLRHLAPGSRVADALTAAGGALPGADTTTLNLARPLTDGEQLLVGRPAPPADTSSDGVEEGAGAVAGGDVGVAALPGPASPLSLNSASAAQLDALPGVGPVLARHIVDFRTQHGGFTALQQLREVPGIGDRKFSTLKSLVEP